MGWGSGDRPADRILWLQPWGCLLSGVRRLGGAPRLQLGDGRAQSLLNLQDGFLILVGVPRPEKTFQAVLPPARHDVDVQMRNTLADVVVDGDQGAMSFQALLHSACQQLGVGEQRCDQSKRQIIQRLIVTFRDQQTMPWEKGPTIEKRQRYLVREDVIALLIATDDLAKDARLRCGTGHSHLWPLASVHRYRV